MGTNTCVTLALAISWVAFGQLAPSSPTFEVASVKSSKAGGRGTSLLTDPAGRFVAERATLRQLITFAYGIRDFQVSGGQSWIDTDQFDIVAKPSAKSSRAQTLLMAQSLLADRFQLKVHRETRELPIFALVVGKNGPKFKEAKPDETRTEKGLQGARGELTGVGASMGSLAARLAAAAGRVVIDRTGLAGKYDFKLQWTPDQPAAESASGTSVFTAVQEQLGLKLEAQKRPVEILVIERAAKPSAN